jgi:hypothetical protein
MTMNRSTQPGTRHRSGVAVFAAWSLLLGNAAVQAQEGGQAAAADNAIVASITPVAQGLACSDAAQQAQVSFDFQKPDFDIKQISLYVDGHGVAQDAVNQQWPRVTLSRGLHEGRNSVEIVATGDNDRSIARQLTVLIGAPQQAGDDNAAVVECDNSRSQIAATPPPPVATQQEQQTVVAAPAEVAPTTVYVEQPVYVYHTVPAYPVWPVFIPIIPVVIGYPSPPVWYTPTYCPPPVVTYYPAPPPRYPPPVAYRPPPYQPPPTQNSWRTPYPGNGVPMPLHGVPQPLQQATPASPGAPRPSRGTVFYSTQSSGDPHWGVVSDMNAGGTGTRYRTPPPPASNVQQPSLQSRPAYPQTYSQGQPSQWMHAPSGNSNVMSSHSAPRQNFVREPQVQRYEAPRAMPPPRMTSAPSFHGSPHGGWH